MIISQTNLKETFTIAKIKIRKVLHKRNIYIYIYY